MGTPGTAGAGSSAIATELKQLNSINIELGNLGIQQAEILGNTSISIQTGYRAINPSFAVSTTQNGFYRSGAAGRLGNDGIYFDNTIDGAIAEFQYHCPEMTPAVFELKYTEGTVLEINPPSGYFSQPLPFTQDASILMAPSLRAPGTTNFLIRYGYSVGKQIQ
ncbi:MAG TPA: hypothetical protein VK174_11385 [Chitinophagales bacterium]|nr:hypothetical protein [Chitinophagales bacterium]